MLAGTHASCTGHSIHSLFDVLRGALAQSRRCIIDVFLRRALYAADALLGLTGDFARLAGPIAGAHLVERGTSFFAHFIPGASCAFPQLATALLAACRRHHNAESHTNPQTR